MIAVLGPGAMIRIRVGFAASTRCEVDLQHLYLGHVAVEATLLGLVLGQLYVDVSRVRQGYLASGKRRNSWYFSVR